MELIIYVKEEHGNDSLPEESTEVHTHREAEKLRGLPASCVLCSMLPESKI